jgi:putative transposase
MSENEKKYHHASHSKYLLLAHLVFAVKYRKKLLLEKVVEDMKAILLEIAENSDFSIDVLETDLDYIHISGLSASIIHFPDRASVEVVVHRRIWEKYPKPLSYQFWKERTFWSDGYFSCSTGDASADTIRKYIEEQG